jgi:hypothetical protein
VVVPALEALGRLGARGHVAPEVLAPALPAVAAVLASHIGASGTVVRAALLAVQYLGMCEVCGPHLRAMVPLALSAMVAHGHQKRVVAACIAHLSRTAEDPEARARHLPSVLRAWDAELAREQAESGVELGPAEGSSSESRGLGRGQEQEPVPALAQDDSQQESEWERTDSPDFSNHVTCAALTYLASFGAPRRDGHSGAPCLVPLDAVPRVLAALAGSDSGSKALGCATYCLQALPPVTAEDGGWPLHCLGPPAPPPPRLFVMPPTHCCLAPARPAPRGRIPQTLPCRHPGLSASPRLEH